MPATAWATSVNRMPAAYSRLACSGLRRTHSRSA